MTETVTFHNLDFTFERVETFTEMPILYIGFNANNHQEALEKYMGWARKPIHTKVIWWVPKYPLGNKPTRTYAFTKGE